MKKIRILYVVHNMATKSGVSSVIMNYYRRLDHKKFQIDFLLFKKYESSYEEELLNNGSHVYYVSSKFSILSYKEIDIFFKNNYFDIVELHSPTLSYLVMKCAFINNVPIRITHTHSTSMSSNKIKNLINHALNFNLLKYANIYFSCSNSSALYWYGQEVMDSDSYFLIANGIDVHKYRYDEKKRKEIRKKLNIENNKVIGFVGRMSKDKNLTFLSDVMREVIDRDSNIKFVLVGDGNELKRLEESTYNLHKNVIFLGMRKDVDELLNSFDLLVLPSKREGLPMVLLEAQASNVHCLVSDTVTREVDIGNVTFIPLEKEKWVYAILNTNNISRDVTVNKFDIEICVKKLEKIYQNFFRKDDF